MQWFKEDSRFTLFGNRDLLRLLVPLVIEQVLFIAVGFFDFIMVASLGEVSVSSVSLVDMLNIFVAQLYASLATGGAVIVSQFVGAKQLPQARDAGRQLIILTFLLSSFFMVIALVGYRQVLRLFFGVLPDDVMASASTYLRITAASYPLVGIYSCCTAILRSINKTKMTMMCSLFCNIANIAGNALLIYVFKMGVAGAALSTFNARLVSVVTILWFAMDKRNIVYVSFKQGFGLTRHVVKRILTIGVPSGVENSLFSFGRLLLTSFIAKFGVVEITASAVANTMGGVGCIVGGACCLGMMTVAGQCVGAGNEEQLRYYFKKMMAWTYTAHIAWNIILMALTPLLLKMCTELSPEALHLAWILILIHNGLGTLLWPASFVFPNFFRAANDVRFTMCVSVISMISIRVLFAWLGTLVFGVGALVVWSAMVLDWMVRIFCFFWRYRSNVWRKYAHCG